MRSDDLLASVFPDVAACQENIEGDIQIPDHPLVHEVMKDVLTEAMDIEGLQTLLGASRTAAIRCIAVDTPVPSQFSHEILNANPYAYLDDAPLEERRARAVEMRRMLPESVLEEVGKLDPAAIAQVREEAWPDVRDADELHDVLHTLVALPAERRDADRSDRPAMSAQLTALLRSPRCWAVPRALAPSERCDRWGIFFEQLVRDGTSHARAAGEIAAFWVAAEKAQSFVLLFPQARIRSAIPDDRREAYRLRRCPVLRWSWLDVASGPQSSASQLAEALGLPASEIEKRFLRLEASGAILRGKFTDPKVEETEWCERRLLARIHRLTVATLRKQIEPVTAAQFMRWLLRWQHVAPASQVRRRARRARGPAPAAGIRDSRERLGAADPGAPHRRLRSEVARPALPDRRGRLGTAVAASCDARRLGRGQAPGDPDQRGAHHVLRARGSGLDDAQARLAPTQPEARGLSHGRATGTRVSAPARRIVFRRHRARDRQAQSRSRNRALGTGRGRTGHRRRLRQPARADRSETARRARQWARRASAAQCRTLGACCYTDQRAERNRAVEATCWMLLKRYGIVFRDVLARETNLPTWRELLMALPPA